MSITRLSGGLTPADGSDPRTFPAIFNDVADTVESQGSAITGAESDIDALEADSIPTDVTSPVAGDKLVFDGTNFVNLEAFAFVGTVTFESNGTFVKGDFPFLRAIRVKCQGGGGGGGRTRSDRNAAGGAGGGYGESFISESSLSSSESVTVGGGGAGATALSSNGGNGGVSSFGTLASGLGGQGTASSGRNALNGGGGTGDVVFHGGDGFPGSVVSLIDGGQPGNGGSSHLGGGGRGGSVVSSGGGQNGRQYGGGGGGASEDGASGGDGADGIVIVELFA